MKKKRNILLISFATCNALAMDNQKNYLTMSNQSIFFTAEKKHLCLAVWGGMLYALTSDYTDEQNRKLNWEDRLKLEVEGTNHTLGCLLKAGASEMLKNGYNIVDSPCTCHNGLKKFGVKESMFFDRKRIGKWPFDPDEICRLLCFKGSSDESERSYQYYKIEPVLHDEKELDKFKGLSTAIKDAIPTEEASFQDVFQVVEKLLSENVKKSK